MKMADRPALWEANRSRAMNEVYWPKPAPTILPKDLLGFYDFIAKHIGSERNITYLEFGVAQGRSIKKIAELFTHPEARFYGFDSFEGLPESWLMHDVGAFTNNGRLPQTDDKRVSFVQGWFQNTVPGFLEEFPKDSRGLTLIHIDADLYSSTLFVLTMLWPVFDEFYIIFDDFIYDEVIALRDFLTAFPVDLEFFAQTKGGGERPNPDQVFGHMKRKRFELPAKAASE
jgi:O-methyltransferase